MVVLGEGEDEATSVACDSLYRAMFFLLRGVKGEPKALFSSHSLTTCN